MSACAGVLLAAAACSAPERYELTYRVSDASVPTPEVVAAVDARLKDLGLGAALADPDHPAQVRCRLWGDHEHDINAAKSAVALNGRLEIRIVASEEAIATETERRAREGDQYVTAPGHAWVPTKDEGELLVRIPERGLKTELRGLDTGGTEAKANVAELERLRSAEVFTHADVEAAEVELDRQIFDFFVVFRIRPDRANAFRLFTGKNVGNRVAWIIDGTIETAPRIARRLEGTAAIQGAGVGFNDYDAQALATALTLGPLPVPLELVAERRMTK